MPRKANELLTNVRDLWKHVTGVCGNKPSACMLAVHGAIRKAVSGELDLRPLRDVANRIGEHKEFVTHRRIYLPVVTGEWQITNADMRLWGDLCLFGKRDYLPDHWHWIGNDVGDALCNKRRHQAYERYAAGGGLSDRHRRLLAGLIWDLDVRRGDWVSLYVEGKRPFGNSCREMDIFETAGLDGEWEEDEDMPAEIKERCWDLFDELQFAIADALAFDGGEK